MRALLLASILAAAPLLAPAPARAEAVESDPFRARLAQNVGIAAKARSTLDTQAKRKAPKGLSAEQRRGYDEQSKWLAETAARFGVLETKLKAVMAKPKAPASEIVQLNAEFGAARDAATTESQRFDGVAPACHDRHTAAVTALRG